MLGSGFRDYPRGGMLLDPTSLRGVASQGARAVLPPHTLRFLRRLTAILLRVTISSFGRLNGFDLVHCGV